jgi:hypothetical protein
MGFFSWKCAKSGESIANQYSNKPLSQRQCYLVTPNQTIYEEDYEGYGEFGGKDVYGLMADGDRDKGIDLFFSGEAPFKIKIVLAKHYNGETYNDLKESEDCEYQGYFYDDDEEDCDEEEY